ncbi:hypothetical protein [Reyranella sp.]|uniref:hypothetical protein n=1 Tax=Reyranella sp. TaxID=1929291 RepID=UPI0025CDAC50|nr:hypothetical protein [Reyranella sp.]
MRALLLLMALLLPMPALAQTEGVIVRTTVKPEQGAVLGQHVSVFVDVLFPGEMPRPPQVALGEMPGAQIVRYETQATTMSDTIDGKTYTGQRFEFALYARRGGRLAIPAATVTLLTSNGDVAGHVQGKATDVQIAVPPGVDPSRPVVATDSLTLDEQWQPAPSSPFKAGDAIVRTITRAAADVPGMAMLDLLFTAPPGVRVYVDPPQSDDQISRGVVTGRRTDRVTYVFEVDGSFVIPELVQPWWDLSANRLRRAVGGGATIAVTAAPVTVSPLERTGRWIFAAVTALGMVTLAIWIWPRIARWRATRHAHWLASEAKAFGDLKASCRQNKPEITYGAFVVWRRRLPRPADGAALAEEIEAVLFAGAPWSLNRAEAFAKKAERLRHTAIRQRQVGVLPPLNPAMSWRD